MSELKDKIHKICIDIGENTEDLDLHVFGIIEKDLNRKISQEEKAYIRYLLDQDAKSRASMQNKTQYSDDWREKLK